MKTLKLTIKNIKTFRNFEIEICLERGLYAVTGTNGVGKSTVMSILSQPFQPNVLKQLFDREKNDDSEVIIEYDGGINKSYVENDLWKTVHSGKTINIRGFHEGSVIHGTRFTDANHTAIKNATNVTNTDLVEADDFVKEQLSKILHGHAGEYQNLKRIKHKQIALKKFSLNAVTYFNIYNNILISQLSMSTGESLLISLLHFLNNTVVRNRDKVSSKLILIDEVELALHPSALKRLVDLLNSLSKEHNLVVYFSTHSIELVRNISPTNVFYLQKEIFGDASVINPCYPAYATRSLYDHDGFDFLILVEDELAKYIVKRTIDENNLYESKLIHVLPCAGWENTIKLHQDIVSSNLVGLGTVVMTMLDGDIECDYRRKFGEDKIYSGLNIQFLPINSLEKYLIQKLLGSFDQKFWKQIGDRYFRIRGINDILSDYKQNFPVDSNGKKLYMLLRACAGEQGMSEDIFLTNMCEYIYTYDGFNGLSQKLARTIG